jgi:hypothetical protein
VTRRSVEGGVRKAAMWTDHQRIEERSLVLHKEIARRLQKDPQLLQIAKGNLIRWIARNGEIPVWREWSEILNGPMGQVLSVLISPDENAARLRQSSPFCGILSPRERWKIYESFTIRTYYSSSGEHCR